MTCKKHGIENCFECRGVLKYSTLELLWWARYELRGAHNTFLDLRAGVKKFAAICSCERCISWRIRFIEMGWVHREVAIIALAQRATDIDTRLCHISA